METSLLSLKIRYRTASSILSSLVSEKMNYGYVFSSLSRKEQAGFKLKKLIMRLNKCNNKKKYMEKM